MDVLATALEGSTHLEKAPENILALTSRLVSGLLLTANHAHAVAPDLWTCLRGKLQAKYYVATMKSLSKPPAC